MGLLPLPDPPGVFVIPEIFVVSRFAQPSALAGSLAGLLTVGPGTKALPLPMPVIRKKKFLAVRAFTAARLNLHRFENQTDQFEENSGEGGRKSRQEENSERRRRKKSFQ
jgi:hypothetical protein